MISSAFEVVFGNFFAHPALAIIAIALGLITCIWEVQEATPFKFSLFFGCLATVGSYLVELILYFVILIIITAIPTIIAILIVLFILIII